MCKHMHFKRKLQVLSLSLLWFGRVLTWEHPGFIYWSDFSFALLFPLLSEPVEPRRLIGDSF